MRSLQFSALLLILVSLVATRADKTEWLSEKRHGYTYLFTPADEINKKEYLKILDSGIKTAEDFFKKPFRREFEVYVHPNRASLDQQWQQDWNMPGFKSECWMVASGTAAKLDMISPKRWDTEACEHSWSDAVKTRRLIAHELFHVYHGQQNASPDFSDVTALDWFVEGFATYASGQCDSARLAEVRKAVASKSVPPTLDDFWKGKLKYGLSGSVVLFIDKKYGRDKLEQLLPFNKKDQVLEALGTSEGELLKEWAVFITRYP